MTDYPADGPIPVDALPEDAEPALREAIALACERVRANPGL